MSVESRNGQKKMTVIDHTVELLTRLRIILVSVFLLGFFVAFWPLEITEMFSTSLEYTPLVSLIMNRMKEDLLPQGAMLIAGNIMDTAYLYLTVSVLIGVILSSPIIAYELYMFFNPALIPAERKWASKVIGSFIGLMMFGAFLAYRVILPITFRILMWFVRSAGAEPIFHVADFVSIIVTLMLGVGILYSAPVFVVLLVERGVLSSSQLSGNRRIVYLLFIVVAAVLTPDPTIVSDIILFAPFAIIFETVVFLSKRIDKRKALEEKMSTMATS